MSASDDDLLLQLLIKGLQPGAAEAIANDAGNKFSSAMQAVNAKLLSLHETQGRLLLSSDINRVQKQINEEQKKGRIIQGLIDEQAKAYERANAAAQKSADEQLKAYEKLQKAAEKEASREQNPFAGIMGSLQGVKNVLHISEMIASSVEAGVAKFFELSEAIIRTTQVYGSLKGSIEDAQRATGDEVSKMDLIIAKNKASQLEMNLTDRQFAIIAESAKAFADAVGTDTADALNQLITGVGTAREKTLKLMGVFVDSKQVYEDLAKSRGVTIDQLTEEEKRTAFQSEALILLNQKNLEAVKGHETFANALERTGTAMKDLKTDTLATVGGSTAAGEAWTTWTKGMSYSAEAITTVATGGLAQLYWYQKRVKEGADEDAEAFDAMTRDAHKLAKELNAVNKERRDLADYLAPLAGQGGEMEASDPFSSGMARYDASRATAAPARTSKVPKPKGAGGSGPSTIIAVDYQQMMKDRAEAMYQAAWKGIDEVDKTRKADEAMLKLLGLGSAEEEEKVAKELEDDINAMIGKMRFAKAEHRLSGAGVDKGGIMATLMFGPAGAEGWTEAVLATSQSTIEIMGTVAAAGMEMAAAVGASLADLAAGDDTSFAKRSRDILKNLSAVAYTQAVFETAMGLAALATGNPIAGGNAASHFVAAAAFAGVGTAAGLSARMIPSGSSASAGSGAAVQRGSGAQTSFGGASSAPGARPDESKTIIQPQFFVWPGGEAEAGREFVKYVEAYQRSSGRRLLQGNV